MITALLCLLALGTELTFDTSTTFVRAGASASSSADLTAELFGPSAPAHAAVPVRWVTFVDYPETLEYREETTARYSEPVLTGLHRPPILTLQIAA